MVEISTDSMNRTGPRQPAGSRASTARSRSSRSRNSPGSAGTRGDSSSSNHLGWGKPPVPITRMPLLPPPLPGPPQPEQPRLGRDQGRLQLLEPPRVGEVPGADHADALAPPHQGQVLQVAVPTAGSRVLRVDVEVRVERHGANLPWGARGS